MFGRFATLIIAIATIAPTTTLAQDKDPERDILVTFENSAFRTSGTGAPYRARKRYTISAEARRHAESVAREFGLEQVADWPHSLTVRLLLCLPRCEQRRSRPDHRSAASRHEGRVGSGPERIRDQRHGKRGL